MIYEIEREAKTALMVIEIAPLSPVRIVVQRTSARTFTARFAAHEAQRPMHELSQEFLRRTWNASSELEAVAALLRDLQERAEAQFDGIDWRRLSERIFESL